MRNLYISDLHIFHNNIIYFDDRPFKDTDEMTDEIKQRTVEFKDYLNQQKSIYGGMVSRIDDFIGHVLVNIYKEEMN